MKRSIYLSILSVVIGFGGLTSCTNLDEKLFSEVTANEYYKSSDEVIAAIMRPWGHFCGTMGIAQAPWLLQELSADGAAWCQKGRHGYDGGDWIRLHRHEWTPLEGQISGAWGQMYQGIGLANKFIQDFNEIDFDALKVPVTKVQAIAEMRLYRAFCYWVLLDLYREVPVTETLDVLNPETKSAKELFDYIEKEIKECLPDLSEDKTKTYGRVSKWGAQTLLAKLYLNAETYTGTSRWDDCITACIEVEKGGFEIDKNWNDPFKVDNDQNSKENIWVIVYDQIYAKGNGWYVRWLHYAHQTGWNLKSGPWNGLVTQPTFFDSFEDNDKRKTEGFLIGLQYPRKKDRDGNYYFDKEAKPLLGSEEYKDKPLEFVNHIVAMDKGEENSGARSVKYEIIEQSTSDQDNDWVLFRYADVLFMKAEAMMRKNGNVANQDAVDLINSVRKRAFSEEDWKKAAYTVASLTMDELCKERGREFAFEGTRRSDLVRFNKFVTTEWWDKKASNKEAYNIFPIPQKQLDANQNLKPNAANLMFK